MTLPPGFMTIVMKTVLVAVIALLRQCRQVTADQDATRPRACGDHEGLSGCGVRDDVRKRTRRCREDDVRADLREDNPTMSRRVRRQQVDHVTGDGQVRIRGDRIKQQSRSATHLIADLIARNRRRRGVVQSETQAGASVFLELNPVIRDTERRRDC